MFESRPKPHSGEKLDGDGSSPFSTNRLGSAEIGVSISRLLLPYELLFVGGGGRANGFGGPVAPALKSELALGEGGGNTTPEE
jgi:hypothetical protein